ncbi:hypothetical protein BLOT_016505 [Blomia tropicalis]|nr:hypothetical protein BLOT_016505 [Blomia tropicalis]
MLNTKTVMDNIINSLELRSKRRQELFESVRECLENERRSPRYRINPGNDFSLWFETSVPRMNEDVFRSHFRMGRPTFNYIVDMTQVETKPNTDSYLIVSLACYQQATTILGDWLHPPMEKSNILENDGQNFTRFPLCVYLCGSYSRCIKFGVVSCRSQFMLV